MSFTAPRTWVYGETVTEAQFNEQFRDNLNAIWVGTNAGDMDYYTSNATKSRLAGGTANAGVCLRMDSGGTAPEYGGVVTNRQGGTATDWSVAGTNIYTPAKSIIQCGMITVPTTSTYVGSATLIFPVAFSAKPIIFLSARSSVVYVYAPDGDITNTQCTIGTGKDSYVGQALTQQTVFWLAIGPV